jgi:hypothetical protein
MLASGVVLARTAPGSGGPRRTVHRRLAWAFLALIVLTSGLGFAMVWLAEPR